MSTRSIEELYPLVTEAIRRAEVLEDLRAPGARPAYLDVSLLEERVAECLPASDPEGALARRGAVRAALSANEPVRARHLAEQYRAETGADDELRNELCHLSEQAEHRLANLDRVNLETLEHARDLYRHTLERMLEEHLRDSDERLQNILESQRRFLESVLESLSRVGRRRKR
jgi:hypothetical protein